ncbi:xanthine dehydrogenase small subunit [Microbacterium sp. SD291]|uniref:xanthine dehydrogenase small subunit n=1 Tax=Microbacterium sp. SD291 TaxID=2782007 RepID=UPI001A970EEC|nr:FAD binding domain-containing protein [Microbacterium sp. SD291]MBO0981853.1 FAD binding domain-containing protein [Microbacterium sp. SD291]
MTDIAVTINGKRRPLAGTETNTTALDWLRANGLSGSKEGCAEGECGACAMLLATPAADGGSTWTAVNACLVPVYALDGQEVVTAEGLGTPESMHPVQEKLAGAGGSQCGYCTPGFACSMAGEYYRADRTAPEQPAECDAEHGPNGFDLHALSGNLCRCTGYRPIRDAAYTLGSPDDEDPLRQRLEQPAPAVVATDVEAGGSRFVRPASLAEALRLLRDEPDALLVAGSTDWGVEVNIRGRRAPFAIAIEQLPELRTLSIDDDRIEIGAALTLSEIEKQLDGAVPLLGELLPQFASRLIRNRATIGGNLGTGSPIGDTPPALLALGARLVLVSADGSGSGSGITEREVELSEYFTGYRQTVRRPGELIRAVRIPLPLAGLTAFHKIAKRRFDDISSVAIAFALDIEDGFVTAARIGLGGVAATPLRAYATEAALVGRPWDLDTVREAAAVLGSEGTPMSDHRASSEYRALMLGNALRKLHSTTSVEPKEVPA